MLFYRVENEQHNGPYFASVDIVTFLIRRNIIECGWDDKYLCNHPTPKNDEILSPIWGKLQNSEDYIFGFESMDKVFNWFCLPEEIQYLEEFHFRISIYETQDYHHGKWQSVANKNSLKLVDFLEF